MSDISVCIVTHQNENKIKKTIDSLLEALPGGRTTQIFVIDNASKDGTLAILEPYQGRIKIIQSDRGNIGFGAGHNLILPQLDSTFHVIMNPDITLAQHDSLDILCRYLEEHLDVGMVVPRVYSNRGELQPLCRREPTLLDLVIRYLPGRFMYRRQCYHTMQDYDYGKPFDVPFASGCFMVMRTDLFRRLGGFDERYYLYLEDADLSRRINQVSRIVYVPEATVIHDWERSSYRKLRLMRIHLHSLWLYFRKWGFKFS